MTVKLEQLGLGSVRAVCPVHGPVLFSARETADVDVFVREHETCGTAPADLSALFAGVGGPAPTEPAAAMREMAAAWWQLQAAMVEQGFGPEQALFLLGQLVNGAALGAALANGQSGAGGG